MIGKEDRHLQAINHIKFMINIDILVVTLNSEYPQARPVSTVCRRCCLWLCGDMTASLRRLSGSLH